MREFSSIVDTCVCTSSLYLAKIADYIKNKIILNLYTKFNVWICWCFDTLNVRYHVASRWFDIDAIWPSCSLNPSVFSVGRHVTDVQRTQQPAAVAGALRHAALPPGTPPPDARRPAAPHAHAPTAPTHGDAWPTPRDATPSQLERTPAPGPATTSLWWVWPLVHCITKCTLVIFFQKLPPHK